MRLCNRALVAISIIVRGYAFIKDMVKEEIASQRISDLKFLVLPIDLVSETYIDSETSWWTNTIWTGVDWSCRTQTPIVAWINRACHVQAARRTINWIRWIRSWSGTWFTIFRRHCSSAIVDTELFSTEMYVGFIYWQETLFARKKIVAISLLTNYVVSRELGSKSNEYKLHWNIPFTSYCLNCLSKNILCCPSSRYRIWEYSESVISHMISYDCFYKRQRYIDPW